MKFLAIFLLLPASTLAGTVGLHLGSVHLPKKDFNNVNPGIYYQWDSGVTVGTFYNSERRQSVYAGWTWEWGRLNLTAGLITGYRRASILPLAAPSVKLGTVGQVTWRLIFLPRVERSGAHVLHLTAEF